MAARSDVRWWICAVIGAALVAFLWEVAPPLWQHYRLLQPEVDQRSQFASDELPDLMRKYPAFMPRMGHENNEIVSRGTWGPVIERAYQRFTLVRLAASVAQWFGNNLLLRLMSPQNTWEFVGVVALLAVALLVFAVTAWAASNLWGSYIVANTMRLNRRVLISKVQNDAMSSSPPPFGGNAAVELATDSD